jgi:hypothetical protein
VNQIDVSVVIGLAALAGALIGGTVSGLVEHWLATPRPEPRARWRVGPAELAERVRREMQGRGRDPR